MRAVAPGRGPWRADRLPAPHRRRPRPDVTAPRVTARGKARLRRGGTRKFCRRVAVRNRSGRCRYISRYRNISGRRGRNEGWPELKDRNRVANGDRADAENIDVQAATVDQVLDDAGAGHLLQVPARLADLDARALDVADPEPLADQVVDPDAAHDHLAAGLRAGEADILQDLRLDQRQAVARVTMIAEVPVADQPLPGDRRHRGHRGDGVARADVDRFD